MNKIKRLRNLMRTSGVAAYIVPGTDPHASEYMAAHWMEMQWLSGFTGEAGTLVVTLDDAGLFTDSRYYLQADIELKDTGITLMRASDIDCPSVEEWLISRLKANDIVAVNSEMWSVNDYETLLASFLNHDISVKNIDLIAPLWTDSRPPIPSSLLYPYDEKYAGESVEDKLNRIRQTMAKHNADALIISALDEIAWLLNIRGNDVEYNPVVISYLLLEKEHCTLFINSAKIDETAHRYLSSLHIIVREYTEVYPALSALHGSVMLDPARVNEALFAALPERTRIIKEQSPVLIDKSRKNPIELEGERKAMKQDAVALTRFFKWLEEKMANMRTDNGLRLTEWDLMEQLHEFRLQGENFIEESFGTIAGYKGNGAIVHYAATPDNCATIHPEGMLLLDSGGQYLDGTTDITRTVWLGGDIPQQAKLDYTYVLKGHIALARARFPLGTRGNQIDALAKQYMWQAGITYGHGTGHGVGHFLGCHEGPQNIRTDMNPTQLQPGNICSDEPGIYRTGQWGIRIENLVAVQDEPTTEAATTNDRFLSFETLTLCYYDTSLIEITLLTDDEKQWLNDYHRRVADTICPLLTSDEASWLRQKCKDI